MEKVIEGATKDIGICELKEEQKKAVYLFVGGKDGLFSCRQGMASRMVSLCYRWFSTVCEEMLGRLLYVFHRWRHNHLKLSGC